MATRGGEYTSLTWWAVERIWPCYARGRKPRSLSKSKNELKKWETQKKDAKEKVDKMAKKLDKIGDKTTATYKKLQDDHLAAVAELKELEEKQPSENSQEYKRLEDRGKEIKKQK